MSSNNLTVLLTNDDGPPGPHSPYIYGLYRHLSRNMGWNVKVVIPSSQKSWIGKAYHIAQIVEGRYYYPRDPDGQGEVSSVSRPLKEGEIAEWILLDGTPATCANVALHNIYHGQIDLLISGPNLGRNSSAAFVLSSGTVGAAMSSSLSQVRSIAVSYGTVIHPTPTTFNDPAHSLAVRIIKYLYSNWGQDEGGLRNGEVDLYNVNIPMIEELLSNEGLPTVWSSIWRNSYGQLFQALSTAEAAAEQSVSPAGPDSNSNTGAAENSPGAEIAPINVGNLVFKFSPDLSDIITPSPSSVPVGSDGWAMAKGYASVTPLLACFAEAVTRPDGNGQVIKL